MIEVAGTYGVVRVRKHDARTGKLVYDKHFKNQIQTFALEQAAAMWSGSTVDTPNYIEVGTGSPPSGQSGTTPDDGGLWTPLSGTMKMCDYATPWLNVYTQWSVAYDTTEALAPITSGNPTGQITLTEAGLFDVNGGCWSHVQLVGVTHDNTTILTIQWQILQQGN